VSLFEMVVVAKDAGWVAQRFTQLNAWEQSWCVWQYALVFSCFAKKT
jgi:hypothetical protein